MIGRPIGSEDQDVGPHGVKAEINVTSLVDVAFTLLIIFMITAPVLQGGVEVTVPKAPASRWPVSSSTRSRSPSTVPRKKRKRHPR